MLKPVGNRILVRRAEPEKQVGSIHIPDTAQKKLFRGTVLAVGPGKYTERGQFLPACPSPDPRTGEPGSIVYPAAVAGVKVGDTLIFGEWSGHEVEDGGEKLVVLEEDDVLLLVVPDAAPAA